MWKHSSWFLLLFCTVGWRLSWLKYISLIFSFLIDKNFPDSIFWSCIFLLHLVPAFPTIHPPSSTTYVPFLSVEDKQALLLVMHTSRICWRSWRQEEQEFKASLATYLKKKQKTSKQTKRPRIFKKKKKKKHKKFTHAQNHKNIKLEIIM